MDKMKLFVVGESTPDPEKWSQWQDVSIVLATSAKSAVEMVTGDPHGEGDEVCEIPMDKAIVLLTRFGADSFLDD